MFLNIFFCVFGDFDHICKSMELRKCIMNICAAVDRFSVQGQCNDVGEAG